MFKVRPAAPAPRPRRRHPRARARALTRLQYLALLVLLAASAYAAAAVDCVDNQFNAQVLTCYGTVTEAPTVRAHDTKFASMFDMLTRLTGLHCFAHDVCFFT